MAIGRTLARRPYNTFTRQGSMRPACTLELTDFNNQREP